MSGDLDLELRYRRVLRLLPGYYRDKWEEDMVAAFLDSWMTGDPDEDSVTMEYDRPSRQEIASVVTLAARLYLGGAGTPRRYFAWGQAVRLAVLAVVLVHATQGLALLTLLTWRRHLAGWFPALPASLAGVPGLTVPIGTTRASAERPRLPIGLQLLAAANAEDTLFRAAAAWEDAHPEVPRSPEA